MSCKDQECLQHLTPREAFAAPWTDLASQRRSTNQRGPHVCKQNVTAMLMQIRFRNKLFKMPEKA